MFRRKSSRTIQADDSAARGAKVTDKVIFLHSDLLHQIHHDKVSVSITPRKSI